MVMQEFAKVMEELSRSTEVEFFPYRTAGVGDVFLRLPRNLLNGLEQALANRAGARMDNHTVYGVKYEEQTIYVWFTDRKVLFGRTIDKRRY